MNDSGEWEAGEIWESGESWATHGLTGHGLDFLIEKAWVPLLNPNTYPISSKQRICLLTFISQSIANSIFPSP